MKAFTYERANSLDQAATASSKPGAKDHRGGNQPARLDEAAS